MGGRNSTYVVNSTDEKIKTTISLGDDLTTAQTDVIDPKEHKTYDFEGKGMIKL
jgi:hypothetical protein